MRKRKSKYSQEQLLNMDAVEIYKLVLSGVQKTFPSGFWKRPEAIENAKKCMEWFFEEYLKFSEKQIKENLSAKLFRDNSLSGMLSHCFDNSPYNAINLLYPEKFKPWDFTRVSRSYWTVENGIEATRWLLEEKLKLSDNDIKNQLSYKLFKENNLAGMVNICFDNSPYRAVDATYPNTFKLSDFNIKSKSQ